MVSAQRMICLSHSFVKMAVLGFKILFVVACLALLFYYGKDLQALLSNSELLTESLYQLGPLAWLGFLVLNILQVVVAPIPGPAFGVAGGFLFGFWKGFLLNIIGILIGSSIAFLLARWLGKPLVDRFVSGKTAKFLQKVATLKGIKGLAIVYLLPFLPDDALCFIVGLTKIKFRTFFALISFCRTPGVLVASLTGSGLVTLPFYAWIAIGILALILVLLYWLKGDQIEAWMKRMVLAN